MTQPFSENQLLLFLQQNVISDEIIHLKRDFSVIERNVETRSSIDAVSTIRIHSISLNRIIVIITCETRPAHSGY
jgi:hypothetical protein